MRVILSVMMFGDNITREEMGKFMRFVRINNTGITMCEYLSSEEWRVITLNDHAHLG
jgi:hypothetical protein